MDKVDKKSYVIAVDVGSSNVVVAVGTMAEGGVLNIEALVSEPTEGVSAGMVDNSKSVGQSLRHARERAEKEAGITITDAYVGISGKFVRSARYTDHVFVEDVDNCISQRDVNALMERMRNVKAADGEVIMDLFPISYRGDSGVEMRNPVGCYSKQLSSTYNFILCEHMAKDRLRRVFLDAGIKIKGMFANAAVVADSVVSTDEKDEGVAVVDIGGGVTDVAIYYGGALRHIVSIPIGGTAVNGDIRAYGIPEKQVEKLKTRYGSAVVDLTPDDIIQVRNSSRSLRHSRICMERDPRCGLREEAGGGYRADGRRRGPEECGRIVPPRYGTGGARSVRRDGRSDGVAGESCIAGLDAGRVDPYKRRTGRSVPGRCGACCGARTQGGTGDTGSGTAFGKRALRRSEISCGGRHSGGSGRCGIDDGRCCSIGGGQARAEGGAGSEPRR